MLRRTIPRAFVGSGIANASGDKMGAVHPDYMFGANYNQDYVGPGWKLTHQILPMDYVGSEGNAWGAQSAAFDRVGPILDPEDPRHPIMIHKRHIPSICASEEQVSTFIAQGEFGYIPESSKFLQVLYQNYLEPFSMNRVAGHLDNWGKVPNNHHESLEFTVEYIGQTASIIGDVTIAAGAVIMEGVTIKADTNQIYIGEGAQILENCNITCDAPSNLLSYQRGEKINPYHTTDLFEGVARIGQNTVVEANCHIEAANIGPYNKIGHGSHIMRDVQTGTVAHILPGSIVVAGTKIGDGELWGGAPAKKLGKVSKYEYKKPYYASLLHREAVVEGEAEQGHYGSHMTQYAAECEVINDLLVEFEGEVTPQIRAQTRELMEGREPFEHTVARTLQWWTPPGHTELYQGGIGFLGCPAWDRPYWMSMNADSDPSWGPSGNLCPLWEYICGNNNRQW